MSKVSPWTDEEVEKLNEFQQSGRFHPFTCPGDSSCPDRTLIATRDGWVCACGQYRQDWAHDFMFKGAPPPMWGESRDRDRDTGRDAGAQGGAGQDRGVEEAEGAGDPDHG